MQAVSTRSSCIRLCRQLAASACVLAAASAPSWACYAPPPSQTIGVQQQLAQAHEVSLAKVVDINRRGDGTVEYAFIEQRHFGAQIQTRFTLTSMADRHPIDRRTFGNHAARAFWERGGGRTMNDIDCVIHPQFAVGATYLVFQDTAATWRSYEEIAEPDDAWLRYVADYFQNRPTTQ